MVQFHIKIVILVRAKREFINLNRALVRYGVDRLVGLLRIVHLQYVARGYRTLGQSVMFLGTLKPVTGRLTAIFSPSGSVQYLSRYLVPYSMPSSEPSVATVQSVS